MNRFLCSLILIVFGIISSPAQSTLSKTWTFESATEISQQDLPEIHSEYDYLKLEDGNFEYRLSARDSSIASGNYVYQNEVLVFFYKHPSDSIANFRVTELTDSTLILTGSKGSFKLRETPVSL